MTKWLRPSGRTEKQKASPACPRSPNRRHQAKIVGGNAMGSVKHLPTTSPHNVQADRANGWITWRQNADA